MTPLPVRAANSIGPMAFSRSLQGRTRTSSKQNQVRPGKCVGTNCAHPCSSPPRRSPYSSFLGSGEPRGSALLALHTHAFIYSV